MKRILACAGAVGLLTTGCIVQSFHPFTSEESKIDVPELRGEYDLLVAWGEDVTDKNVKPWVFQEDKVLTYDETQVSATIKLTFLKSGEVLLCDSAPEDHEKGKTSWYWFWHTAPMHTLCKVELKEDTARFIPLDLEWTAKTSLPHRKEKDWVLFTATTEQWTEFLRKNAGKKEAFDEEHAYVLKKRLPTPTP